tara:strand:- start:470 stop:697 length:228 start_codon:yes stop_codon:yes gene_type:complete
LFPEEKVPQSVSRYVDKRGIRMERFFGKIRPQIFLSIILLGFIAIIGMLKGLNEVTVGCVAGIIALSKDVLQSDS